MIDLLKELKKFDYIWTTEKDQWVLFKFKPEHDDYDMVIYNEQTELINRISHKELRHAVIDKMREEGNRIIDSPF